MGPRVSVWPALDPISHWSPSPPPGPSASTGFSDCSLPAGNMKLVSGVSPAAVQPGRAGPSALGWGPHHPAPQHRVQGWRGRGRRLGGHGRAATMFIHRLRLICNSQPQVCVKIQESVSTELFRFVSGRILTAKVVQ